MPRKEKQKLKLICTLDILKKYSDEQNPINASKIAEYLLDYGIETERKSVYSDIAALGEYGCDIIKAADSKKGWFIGDREFEVPEIYLLSDAVRSAKFISAKKTAELITKLNSMLSVYQSQRKKSVFFGTTDKCGNEELYYNIDKISSAIEEKKQIRLNYSTRGFDSQRRVERKYKEMLINPYALTWQDDHYYLIGNHAKYDNLIHLRLDRINGVEITDTPTRHFSEVSSYKEVFDTADYTNKLFGMYSGEVSKIELCCKRSITEQVLDRFSENIFIKNVTENEFSFTFNGVISDALITWIINYGADLKVVKPDKLRQMVVERARTVLENYSAQRSTDQ